LFQMLARLGRETITAEEAHQAMMMFRRAPHFGLMARNGLATPFFAQPALVPPKPPMPPALHKAVTRLRYTVNALRGAAIANLGLAVGYAFVGNWWISSFDACIGAAAAVLASL